MKKVKLLSLSLLIPVILSADIHVSARKLISSATSEVKVHRTSGIGDNRDIGDLVDNLSNKKDMDLYKSLFAGFLQLASVGFFIATVFKFKQYKDNPTQIPVTTPFALFMVAILSLTSYQIIKPATKTILGEGYDDPSSCTGLPGSADCD